MDYPIVLLSSWLVKTISDKVEDQQTYLSNIVAKGFINYQGPGKCNIDWTPILRVFKYTNTTAKREICAILNESSHKILVLFTRECISKFESEYSQRLTSCPVHSLIIIRRANLRFATNSFLRDNFKGIKIELERGTEVVYLEILEIEVFYRTAMRVEATHENKLRFVYGAENYREKFNKENINNDGLKWSILAMNDGMISDEE
ncbi:CIC11C00000001410 [Sungouiella intermedia]|uniref:Telomere replication protein EST3 n=1 Tax=Sungouiella intermedia TaxID=45354 RepID=A0A1L0DY00_9ASCO|nr:CIC11C00000001410 [[Candida] intermedia]